MSPRRRQLAFDMTVWIATPVLVLALLSFEAAARRTEAPADPAYRTECGSCHVAFPPGLLGRPAWRTIVGGLDRHFGVDASLDAATASRIGAYLDAHAGRDAAAQGTAEPPRISRTDWFVREHRKVSAAFASPAVGSAANCAACHREASRGNFDEHSVRVPSATGSGR